MRRRPLVPGAARLGQGRVVLDDLAGDVGLGLSADKYRVPTVNSGSGPGPSSPVSPIMHLFVQRTSSEHMHANVSGRPGLRSAHAAVTHAYSHFDSSTPVATGGVLVHDRRRADNTPCSTFWRSRAYNPCLQPQNQPTPWSAAVPHRSSTCGGKVVSTDLSTHSGLVSAATLKPTAPSEALHTRRRREQVAGTSRFCSAGQRATAAPL